MQICGFGKAKVEKYGDEIIDAVESYCHRYGIESNMAAKANRPKIERNNKATVVKTDTKRASFDLFKEGKNIQEIAVIRSLTLDTIESHLIHYVSTGEIDINDLVSNEKQQ